MLLSTGRVRSRGLPAAWLAEASNANPWPGGGEYRPDALTGPIALRVLQAAQPKAMFIGLGDTDEYEWKGDDLVFRKEITFAESILGFTESLLDHPNGESPTVTWRGGPLLHGAMLKMEGGGMPKKAGGYGNLYFQVLVTPPEVRPWTTEEATKLQSVVGGEGASLADAGATPLSLSSAEPKVSIDRT